MSEDSKLIGNFGFLITLNFISAIAIGFALLWVVVFNDYVMYYLYSAYEALFSQGLIAAWVGTLMENINTTVTLVIPNYIDIMWMAFFVVFVIQLFVVSYKLDRESYFSALGFLLFGILITLFLGGIFLQLTDWVQVEFFGRLIPTLSTVTPLFNYYVTNAGVINSIIIVICVLLNVIDFDLSGYFTRKEKEGDADKLVEVN